MDRRRVATRINARHVGRRHGERAECGSSVAGVMRPLFLPTDGMVEETLDEPELHRHAAERIGEPADEIDGRGEANVQVNNETVSLSPSSVGYGIGVRESVVDPAWGPRDGDRRDGLEARVSREPCPS